MKCVNNEVDIAVTGVHHSMAIGEGHPERTNEMNGNSIRYGYFVYGWIKFPN